MKKNKKVQNQKKNQNRLKKVKKNWRKGSANKWPQNVHPKKGKKNQNRQEKIPKKIEKSTKKTIKQGQKNYKKKPKMY